AGVERVVDQLPHHCAGAIDDFAGRHSSDDRGVQDRDRPSLGYRTAQVVGPFEAADGSGPDRCRSSARAATWSRCKALIASRGVVAARSSASRAEARSFGGWGLAAGGWGTEDSSVGAGSPTVDCT